MRADTVTPTEKKLEELRSLFPLEEGCTPRFNELLSALWELKDPAAIRPILDLAYDRCPLGGLMDDMLNSLEVYPDQEYVPVFLEALPSFLDRSPDCCEHELRKILWSPGRLGALTESVAHLSPAQASALRVVLNRIDAAALAQSKQALLQLLRLP